MPQQYTFETISGRDFEFLCRDLLQRKITTETGKKFYFNSFSEGKDRGIDGIFQNEEEKIILQCKRYKSFNSLYFELKNIELQKIKSLNPSRYIFVTSIDLSESQVQKLFALLSNHVRDINDIIGQSMINNMLSCYPDIELNYPKLYFNSINVLNRVIHAGTFNQSDNKIKEYHKVSKFYVADESFQQALNILKEKRYVIISGDPGVGKSTLAGMLSLYFVGKDYEFIFLRRGISEGNNVWQDNKKQIFLFDDFLGSTSFDGFSRNEDRELYDFIKNVQASTNKLLLITTREYVFRQAIIKYPELEDLHITKCIIRQKEFTDAFKINILYNYLYHSPVELEHIESLLANERYENIIHHLNFTPRLISDFLEKNYNKNSYKKSFYDDLIEYLNDPFDYWKKIFLRLSNEAQVLLLILSITEQPGIEEFLFATFKNVSEHRTLFEKGFDRDVFEHALIELSESFIAVGVNPELNIHNDYITSVDYSLIYNSFRSSRFIEFQNPSIKDFTITYLEKRKDLIEYLLKSAVLFHQLFFVFSTRDEDKSIEDYDSDYPYRVRKILLSKHLKEILAEKAIVEFDTLLTIRFKKVQWAEGDPDTFHTDGKDEDNRMEKLRLLSVNFSLKEHEVIRNFVEKKYFSILEEDKMYYEAPNSEESKLRPLSLNERLSQPGIINRLRPFVSFDPFQTLNSYYQNIRFSSEFIELKHLGEFFPEAYEEVVLKKIKAVRQQIKDTIYDDIDYYMWDGSYEADGALDELIDIDIEQLMELYQFKLSKRFKADVNEMVGREVFRLKSTVNRPKKISPEDDKNVKDFQLTNNEDLHKQRYNSYEQALMKLIPDWKEFETDEDAMLYLQAKLNTIQSTTDIDNTLSYIDGLGEELMDCPQQIDVLVNTFPSGIKNYLSASYFYEHILKTNELSEEAIYVLEEIAHDLYIEGRLSFRKEVFEDHLRDRIEDEQHSNKILQELLSTDLLIQEDIWFRLLNWPLHIYLAARYIARLSLNEKSLIYNSFKELHDGNGWTYEADIWQYCFDIDQSAFQTHFIIPTLQDSLSLFDNSSKSEIPIIFLKNEGLTLTYSYWKEEQCFDIHCTSGAALLPEDIFREIKLDIEHPASPLENCFNITHSKDPATIAYIERHCLIDDETYAIDFTKELGNKDFHKIVLSSGAAEIILHYLNEVRTYLAINS